MRRWGLPCLLAIVLLSPAASLAAQL